MSNNNKTLYGVLAVVLLLVIVALGVFAYRQYYSDDSDSADTSETATNNDEPIGEETEQTPALTSYQSDKGLAITVSTPTRTDTLKSPLTVKGSVPGSWSNEGQFTVRLLNSEGLTLAEGPASLEGDWMTESLVPFTAILEFEAPASGSSGILLLERANPSGMEENADSLTIPVQF